MRLLSEKKSKINYEHAKTWSLPWTFLVWKFETTTRDFWGWIDLLLYCYYSGSLLIFATPDLQWMCSLCLVRLQTFKFTLHCWNLMIESWHLISLMEGIFLMDTRYYQLPYFISWYGLAYGHEFLTNFREYLLPLAHSTLMNYWTSMHLYFYYYDIVLTSDNVFYYIKDCLHFSDDLCMFFRDKHY